MFPLFFPFKRLRTAFAPFRPVLAGKYLAAYKALALAEAHEADARRVWRLNGDTRTGHALLKAVAARATAQAAYVRACAAVNSLPDSAWPDEADEAFGAAA